MESETAAPSECVSPGAAVAPAVPRKARLPRPRKQKKLENIAKGAFRHRLEQIIASESGTKPEFETFPVDFPPHGTYFYSKVYSPYHGITFRSPHYHLERADAEEDVAEALLIAMGRVKVPRGIRSDLAAADYGRPQRLNVNGDEVL